MLEFALFSVAARHSLVALLDEIGVSHSEYDDGESLIVAIAEHTDEGLLERIEARYDELLMSDQAGIDADEGPQGKQTAGVVLNLASGEAVYAAVDPALLAKVMAVLTAEEFGRLVESIVGAVERPDRRPLCQRD